MKLNHFVAAVLVLPGVAAIAAPYVSPWNSATGDVRKLVTSAVGHLDCIGRDIRSATASGINHVAQPNVLCLGRIELQDLSEAWQDRVVAANREPPPAKDEKRKRDPGKADRPLARE